MRVVPSLDELMRSDACQWTVDDPHGPVSLGAFGHASIPLTAKAWPRTRWRITSWSSSSTRTSRWRRPISRVRSCRVTLLTHPDGTALTGSKRLFAAFGKLFRERFKSCKPVEPEHMVSGSGVSALLDQLLSLLVDEGDGVALATPYYAGFSGVIKARNRAVTIDVHLGDLDPSSPETIRCFDDKFEQLKAEGGPVPQVVILCSPHNPLGVRPRRRDAG